VLVRCSKLKSTIKSTITKVAGQSPNSKTGDTTMAVFSNNGTIALSFEHRNKRFVIRFC